MINCSSAKKRGISMINFILYEKDKKWVKLYKNAILKVMGNKKENYHILIIEEYKKNTLETIANTIGKKIFILTQEMDSKTGIDFAKEIRKTGDWISQIILIKTNEIKNEKSFYNKILLLSSIIKNECTEEKIKESIYTALQILLCHSSYNFTYNHEVYQIPYDDIIYFEKDINDNYTSIITKNKRFKVKKSVRKIEMELLTVPYFFKTHQSCIVNLKQIERVDFSKNLIYFKNRKIDLLSRNKKKELKEKMLELNLYNFI